MTDKQNKSTSSASKRSLVVRILILLVAALMLLGVLIYPFMQMFE